MAVQARARASQLTESHGQGLPGDEKQRGFTIACFLVAMGKYSYFSHARSVWIRTLHPFFLL
jgi:hypothetical protein